MANIKIYGKLVNVTDSNEIADYSQIAGKPILEHDLGASGFTPVEDTYYKHTGATTTTYKQGIIYFYDGNVYKAIDGQVSGSGVENIKDGAGASSLNQVQDGTSGTFDFTGKNPNATALDSTLTGQISYGGTGAFSAAFGGKSQASGKRSFAAGTTVVAKGAYSAAFGDNSVALGNDSFVAGYQNTTYGLASTAFGGENTALGIKSFVTGINSTSQGEAAAAIGYKVNAIADYSFAAGSNTKTDGVAATAFGDHSQAGGNASFASGTKNISTGLSSDSTGGYNTVEGKYASARGASNFIKASYPTDVSGGGGSSSGGSGGSTEEPTETLTPGAYSSVEGNRNTVYGAWSHAQGSNNVIYSHSSSAEGYNNIVGKPVTSLADAGEVTASMHAEGANNKVTGNYSHVGGYNSVVSGQKSFAHGDNQLVSGSNSAAFGGTNIISGDYSAAFGVANTINGSKGLTSGSNNRLESGTINSIASGSANSINSSNSAAFGDSLITSLDNQSVVGAYNKADNSAFFIVGNGSNLDTRQNAFTVHTDGRASIMSAPIASIDAVRKQELDKKQDILISGTNIKTINGTSLLGSGDITISSGGGDVTAAGDNTFTGSNKFNKHITLIYGPEGYVDFGDNNKFYGYYWLQGTNNYQLSVPTITKNETMALKSDIPDTSSFVKVSANNTFTGENVFQQSDSEGGIKIAVSSNVYTKYATYEIIHNTGTNEYLCSLPSKSGTFALTSDIPIKTATLNGDILSITLS